jgi:hypothetical protein
MVVSEMLAHHQTYSKSRIVLSAGTAARASTGSPPMRSVDQPVEK